MVLCEAEQAAQEVAVTLREALALAVAPPGQSVTVDVALRLP